ncbi:hypothetical protein [Stenotrophomonas geniculata]|uniref:hypothetical protein n=1 Tax=Stenotrophomonas geniculata TaxID=86188 RepID=UPI002ACD7F4E|nr:hypothetical protein [Stenotrophomonas geniculata]
MSRSSAQHLFNRNQGSLSVPLGMADVILEVLEFLANNETIPKDRSSFHASTDCTEKTSPSSAQLWKKARLILQTFWNARVADSNAVFFAIDGFDCSDHAQQVGAQIPDVGKNCSGTPGGFRLSLLLSNLCVAAMLPPRHRYRCCDSDDRKNSLNPSGLRFRLQRAPTDKRAIHATPCGLWSEA